MLVGDVPRTDCRIVQLLWGERALPMQEIAGMEGKGPLDVAQPRGYGYDRGVCGQNHQRQCMWGLAAQQSCAVRVRHQQCTQARKRRDRRLGCYTYSKVILVPASDADLEECLTRSERHVWEGTSQRQTVCLPAV